MSHGAAGSRRGLALDAAPREPPNGETDLAGSATASLAAIRPEPPRLAYTEILLDETKETSEAERCEAFHDGYTPTITTEATPHSAACHPPAAFPTSQVSTTRRA